MHTRTQLTQDVSLVRQFSLILEALLSHLSLNRDLIVTNACSQLKKHKIFIPTNSILFARVNLDLLEGSVGSGLQWIYRMSGHRRENLTDVICQTVNKTR